MPTSRSLRVNRPEAGASLLEFLSRRLGLSHKQAKRLLDARSVFVNRRRVWMARHALEAGDVVEVPDVPPARRAAATIPVLFEDEHCLVVDKPPGLTSAGPGSVEEQLRRRHGSEATAVHRLDRDTSGCNLFARSAAARERLVALFGGHDLQKVYRAIALGRVPEDLHLLRSAVDNLEAVTRIRLLRAGAAASYLEAMPETGRTHQIRIHLQKAGHPLAGDRVYATREVDADVLRALPRQMLHAWRLRWVHPFTGATIGVEAPLPADFREALRALRLA